MSPPNLASADLVLTRPDYTGGSLVNLMQSVGAGLGAGANDYAPLRILDSTRIAAARRVVMVVIDGLGERWLETYAPDSALAAWRAGRLTSVYPPTTASAVTTFMTGLAPQQHGLTGWFMHFRKLGLVTAVLPFVPRYGRTPLGVHGVPLAAVVDCPSFYARLPCASVLLLPAELVDSDFSRTLGHGARREGFRDLNEFAARLAHYCGGRDDARYIHAYWSEFDHLAHIRGPSHATVAAHYRALDAALAPLAELCTRHGTLLIVTADHGFIDSGRHERVDIEDHPLFTDCLSLPLCGEPRSPYCYVQARACATFERYVSAQLGEYATAVPSEQLITDGWFGLGTPHPELAARVGDYTLQMRARYTLRDRVIGERDIALAGMHGGITAAEQWIPLLLAGP